MKNYSVAVFGSSLREDFDKYSDKDLLLVAEDIQTLDKLKNIYSNGKWSISYYTYSKLNYLSRNGSLFIKHLQNEAKIVIDKKETLQKILIDFNEKESYQYDITNSKKYFEILKYIPNTTLGNAWFCDCFYVGFRNYFIFKNAEKRMFEFSFNKILTILVEQNKITLSDANILKELRVLKYNYRRDILNEFPSNKFIFKILKIAKKLRILQSSKYVNSKVFQQMVEKNILKLHFNPYQRLRLVEGYYCSEGIDIPEIKKIIVNPQFYASKLKDNEFTIKLIDRIKENNNISKSLKNKTLIMTNI